MEPAELSTYRCPECGMEIPNAAIYRDYHAEHCAGRPEGTDE